MYEGRTLVVCRQEALELGIQEAVVLFKKVGKSHPFGGRSGLLFALRFEWLGRHFAAGFLEQDLHPCFGLLQLFLAIAGKLHALLEELHEIGRASCRERGEISMEAGSAKEKQ